jgi:hypothetical protein
VASAGNARRGLAGLAVFTAPPNQPSLPGIGAGLRVVSLSLQKPAVVIDGNMRVS